MTLHRQLLRAPVLFLVFLLPGAVWALASPLLSVPDEDAHVVKAVAVWSGQLGGTDVRRDDGYIFTTFALPAVWGQANPYPECFKFKREVTADCAPPLTTTDATTGVATTAGHYPPLYYALVGWGGRLAPGATGIYLMRLAGAVIAAAFLALAVRALATVLDPRWALVGVLAAATPMVYFLAGSVNPNGLEIVAAFGVWATALALARWPEGHDGPAPRFLLVGLAVSGVALTFTRSLSPLFLVGILVLVALTARRTSFRALISDRRVLGVGAALVVAVAISSAYILTSGHLEAVPGKPIAPGAGALRNVMGETPAYIQQMVALFGWLDTLVAQVSLYAWLFVIFVLVGLAVALVPVRRNVALLLATAGTVLLPIIAQAPRATTQGLPWQGRYTLPLAIGIPLLAVVSIDPAARMIPGLTRRVVLALGLVIGVGNLYAAWWALRRYVNGSEGSVWVFGGAWQPPLGAAALLAALGAFVAITLLALAATPSAPAALDAPGATGTAGTSGTAPPGQGSSGRSSGPSSGRSSGSAEAAARSGADDPSTAASTAGAGS